MSKNRPQRATASPAESKSALPWLVGGAVAAAVLLIVAITVTAGDDSGGGVKPGGGTPWDQLTQAQREKLVVFGTPKVEGTLPEFTSTENDPAVGQAAPIVTDGQSMMGEPISLEPGTPRMVVFAAHWCHVCQAEIPQLAAWAKDGLIPDGVQAVVVTTGSSDQKNNYPPTKWLINEEWTGDTLADSTTSEMGAAFGLASYPYFVWIDAAGKVTMRAAGALPRESVEAGLKTITP